MYVRKEAMEGEIGKRVIGKVCIKLSYDLESINNENIRQIILVGVSFGFSDPTS